MFNGKARITILRHSIASSQSLGQQTAKHRSAKLADRIEQSSLGRNSTGTGILTCCPSTTLFSLILGPTNPTSIIVAWETLDLRWPDFSSGLKLLMPTFSLPDAPQCLSALLQR